MLLQSKPVCQQKNNSPFFSHQARKTDAISNLSNNKLLPFSTIPGSVDAHKSTTDQTQTLEDFPLGRFMRFLKHIKLKRLLSRISDPRDPEKVVHQIELVLQWVLSVFFFRCESLNHIRTAFEKLPQHKQAQLWNYFGVEGGKDKLPDRTIVTDCLSGLDPEEINDLLEKLFKWAMRSKIFYNHMETLLPDGFYNLACDGVWVHKYDHPHAKNKEGENICPYCLPRVHNKGKENEYTDYLHAFVNLAFIFPGGLKLPIYVYPLKAEQLQGDEAVSDKKHKQECELQAVHVILPIIKQKFGGVHPHRGNFRSFF